MGEAKRRLLGGTMSFAPKEKGAIEEGNLHLQINRNPDGTVIVNFGKQVQWIGFKHNQAIDFAHKIIEYAMGMQCNVHITPKEYDASFDPNPQDQQSLPPSSDLISDDQGK